jgi:putative phosphoribosyl transferase
MPPDALFTDRTAAGRALAERLAPYACDTALVVGLARGGVVVAAEVARALGLPLDALAVRKIGHPFQPEYALGAVAALAQPYLRGADGLDERELAAAVQRARLEAAALDRVLHPDGRTARLAWSRLLLVDDGVATGASMMAAVRWARERRAAAVVVAAPVVSRQALSSLRLQADAVVAVSVPPELPAVGLFYDSFPQVGEEEVLGLLHAAAVGGAA